MKLSDASRRASTPFVSPCLIKGAAHAVLRDSLLNVFHDLTCSSSKVKFNLIELDLT
jgi:hypothetical protein